MDGGQLTGDAADIMDKAHVQHAVCFIQDKNADLVKRDNALAHEVQKPAGAGDEHIAAAVQCIHLGLLSDTAVYDAGTDREGTAVEDKTVINLLGQLTGRCQDQGVDA